MGFFGAGLDLDGDGTNDIFVGTKVGGKGTADPGSFGLGCFFILVVLVSMAIIFNDPDWFEFSKDYIANDLPLQPSRAKRWATRFRFFGPIIFFVPICIGLIVFAYYEIQEKIWEMEATKEEKRYEWEEKQRLKKERFEYHRYLESSNQPESDETEEPSSASNSKSIFSVITDAVTGKYDAEKQDGHHSTSTNESVPFGDIRVMKPDGEIGGPFTKQYLKELKDSGKLSPGLKASRSKDGPWQNLPSG